MVIEIVPPTPDSFDAARSARGSAPRDPCLALAGFFEARIGSVVGRVDWRTSKNPATVRGRGGAERYGVWRAAALTG